MSLPAAPSILSYADAGAAAVDKINTGIEYLSFVKTEMDGLEVTVAGLSADDAAADDQSAAIDGLGAWVGAVEGDFASLSGRVWMMA